MQSTVSASNCLSPESTVTSLLSSSGHLRSSLPSAEPNTPFRYRDKDYDSASAALDAYIADFERIQNHSRFLTGSPPSTRSSARTLRNKDVLQESLTDSELDFLKLPVSSLHHRSNRERLSMTTDELLSIPHDGSMPVTHTSALIQGLLSQSQLHPAARLGLSSQASSRLNHQHPHLSRNSRGSRFMLTPLSSANRAAGTEGPESSSLLHLPRWFTGHKEDMDCSEITSVPDLKYPAWIQHCPRSHPSEPKLWDHPAPRTGAPSWVAELEEDCTELTPSLVDSQQTLKDLRLQFAEQISLLATERKSSDMVEALFRDNRLDLLIQKADHVLRSLSRCSGGVDGPADPANRDADGAEKTEKSCVSTHRPSSSLVSAAASESATEAVSDRARDCSTDDADVWKQPGPLEALKQMMFRLQAVEAELQRQQSASACAGGSEGLRAEETPVKQRPEKEPEREISPSGPSLQRALHHLNRLKQLVEEPQERHLEQEKDLDEGRYSSSSADGTTCNQQIPH